MIKSLKIIAISLPLMALLAVGVLIGWMKWLEFHRPKTDPACFASEKIRVKMGRHVFAIPRKENPYLESGYGNMIKSMCQKEGDPPIGVTMFSFLPDDLPGYSRELQDQEGSFFAVRITVRYAANNKPKDTFEHIARHFREENKDIQDLPKEGNLYKLQKQNHTTFIAIKPDFITPRGNPLVFGCLPYGPPSTASRLDCATSFVWKDGIIFYADQINSSIVPLEQWKTFYHVLIRYLEKLETKSNNN